MNRENILVLRDDDNVGIALADLAPEDDDATPAIREPIPNGHKIARVDIATGTAVIKYGQSIGVAIRDIKAGEHVHSHNLGMPDDGSQRLPSAGATVGAGKQDVAQPSTFMGYERADGRAGTRNYLGVVTTVNCSATVARAIAQQAETRLEQRYNHIDGVVPIVHGTGCGIATDSEAMRVLTRVIDGYSTHPNFAGVLLIGLGCEVNALNRYDRLQQQRPDIRQLAIQETGGSRAAIEAGLGMLDEMAAATAEIERVPIPLSKLRIGLQCGGSDALSGVTANPAMGCAVERLVAAGGGAILSETPEIFGAENLLTGRASDDIAEQIRAKLAWWCDYADQHGVSLDNNPSPGNKQGGLTTILEKSLGAVAKAGNVPLRAVYDYAEPITERGLVFMDSPGFDPCSATGQVASGANLILFSTGRGSCYGCRPAPSLKMASNSDLYRRMADDMDIDCGVMITEKRTVDDLGEAIFQLLVTIASGQATKSELLGYGNDEFVPWQLGAVL